MNQAAVAHLAANLDKLVWPGDDTHEAVPVSIPGIRQPAMPAEMAEKFAADAGLPHSNIARLIVEAEFASLEQAGFTVITKTDLDALTSKASTEPSRHRQVQMFCNACHNPLFRLNVDTEKPGVSGPQLLNALRLLSPECPHGRVDQ